MSDEQKLSDLLGDSTIELKPSERGQMVYLNGEDVTDEIRSSFVTNNVSYVAAHRSVREEMVQRQKDMAIDGGVVMDGRDIGTHVLPHAEVKVFLLASVKERARRRHEENIKKGMESNLEQLMIEIEQRDKLDSEREVAPLVKAHDAIEIDTTSMSITDVVNQIMRLAHERTGVRESL